MTSAFPNRTHTSLAILRIINNETQLISKLIDDADELCKKDNSSLNFVRYYVFYGKIIIHAISFLKEYEILREIHKNHSEIGQLDALIKPLRKRIMKWKDINKYRNVYFAHNFRDPKAGNKFVLFDDYVNTLNAPISHYDIKLVAQIIDMMLHEIGDFFKNEMIVAVFAIADGRNSNKELRKQRFRESVKNETDFNNEIKELELTIGKARNAFL